MKRLLTLMLLVLCLSGCGAPAPAESMESQAPAVQTEPPVPTEPQGLYDPATSLELDPTGAVSCYDLGDFQAEAVRLMGGDPVLFSAGERTRLLKLSGDTRYAAAALDLPLLLPASAPGTQVGNKGITYYDEASRTLVFLDTSLKEVNRLTLPEAMLGEPLLSQDRKALYYATADALRAIDLETRLDRLLLQTAYDRLQLTALHLEGSVLECFVEDEGELFNLYLRTDTGETLGTTEAGLILSSGGGLYFALLERDGYPELLTGTPDGEAFALEPLDYRPQTIPVMELSSLVTVTGDRDGTRLELYDLRLGDRTASLTLPGSGDCRSVVGDPETGCLWMLWFQDGVSRLLCWDPELSAVEDDSVYRLPRRSPEAPDTQGLAACAEEARRIGGQYDVDIRIWEEATALQPEDYLLKGEYRVSLIRHCLQQMDALLAQFPEGFFKTLVPGGDRLQLCLVGGISGGDARSLDTAMGVQFWQGDVPYVAVTAADPLVPTLVHELFHVIDSRVRSTCSLYDDWNSLNPQGFDYDYGYAHTPRDTDQQWTDGEERAFIDTYSMSFPREDRARIMEYAMTEDCGAYFASEAMQHKLRTLCAGIRKAFHLEKLEEPLPWEQYLQGQV